MLTSYDLTSSSPKLRFLTHIKYAKGQIWNWQTLAMLRFDQVMHHRHTHLPTWLHTLQVLASLGLVEWGQIQLLIKETKITTNNVWY